MAAAGSVKEKQFSDLDKRRNKNHIDYLNCARKNKHYNGSLVGDTDRMKFDDYGAFLLDKKVKFANNISQFVNGSAFVNSNENKHPKKASEPEVPRRTRGNGKADKVAEDSETSRVIRDNHRDKYDRLCGACSPEDDGIDMLNKSTDVSSPGSSESASSKDSGIVIDDFGCLGTFADDTLSGTTTPVKSYFDFSSCLPACLEHDRTYDLIAHDNRNNSNNHLFDLASCIKTEPLEITPDTSSCVLVNCERLSVKKNGRIVINSHHPLFQSTHESSRGNLQTPLCHNEHLRNDVGSPSYTTCKWEKCGLSLDQELLLDHLMENHVSTQTGRVFRCLWHGCKVYNRESSKSTWLKRHVLTHSGAKPFACIVDGCALRFCSQNGLERHVNGHFSHAAPSGNSKAARSSRDEATPTPTKHSRKKKLKRRHVNLARKYDLFDVKTMDVLKDELQSSQVQTAGSNLVSFHSQIVAKKCSKSGKIDYLLRWQPTNILHDQWEDQSELCNHLNRKLPPSQLPHDVTNMYGSSYKRHRFRDYRRK